MVKTDSSHRLSIGKIIHALIGNRIGVIALPLLLITALSFSYLQYQSSSLQRVVAAKNNAPKKSTEDPTALPLVVQPSLPTLQATPGQAESESSSIEAANDTDTIGPASKSASKSLQGATTAESANDKNASLQATRQNVKLDQIDQ